MLDRIKKIKFIKDNLVLFIANGLGAGFTFFYHFYVGRALGPEDFSIIGVILSIAYILSVVHYTIQTTIANFTSELKEKREYKKINYIVQNLTYSLFIFGLIGTFVFLLIAKPVSSFLQIQDPLFIQISTPLVLILFLLPTLKGVFQGTQHFMKLGWTLILEGFTRFFGALLLLELGFSTTGAVVAIIISFLIPLLYSLYVSRKNLRKAKEYFPMKKIYKYAIPVFFGILGMTLFYSIDIILVKHFLTAFEAGEYAAISNLGKIIYFGSFTVGMVLFPKISKKNIPKKERRNLLFKSLGLTALIASPLVVLYYLFPKYIISFLYGSAYIGAAPYLGKFGIFITLFALTYILTYYFLGRKKYLPIITLFIFLFLEITLIYFFHSNLSEIVNAITITMFLCFISLCLLLFLTREKDSRYKNLIKK